jgi:hypothetical protein
MRVVGGNPAVDPMKEKPVSFADVCLLLGVLFAFATLVLKVVEVKGRK